MDSSSKTARQPKVNDTDRILQLILAFLGKSAALSGKSTIEIKASKTVIARPEESHCMVFKVSTAQDYAEDFDLQAQAAERVFQGQ